MNLERIVKLNKQNVNIPAKTAAVCSQNVLYLQKNGLMTVPQFGAWDHKDPGATDYSMVFSRARANRKQQKADVRRSYGNEQEILAAHQQDDDPVMVRLHYTEPFSVTYPSLSSIRNMFSYMYM